MLDPMTRRYCDKSTAETFRFTFFCDCCGKELATSPAKFRSGFSPKLIMSSSERRIREILWLRDHDSAYERANREVLDQLNRCEICGDYVCDDCIEVCPELDGKLCCYKCAEVRGFTSTRSISAAVSKNGKTNVLQNGYATPLYHQVFVESQSGRFYAECAVCGKKRFAHSVPAFLRKPKLLELCKIGKASQKQQEAFDKSKADAVSILVRFFNLCRCGGKWVCDGCYDPHSEEGYCKRCMENVTRRDT